MLKSTLSILAGVALVGSLFGSTPAVAQSTDLTAFCDAALEVDQAFDALGEGKVTPRKIDRATAALTALEGSAPPEVATNVASIAGTIRNALDEDEDPSADPSFQQDEEAINAFRYSSCGYETADVTLLEYEFSGLPKSFTTGVVAIKLATTGTEVHEMVIARLKTSHPFKKSLALAEHEQGGRLRYVAQGLAPPDETSYMFVDFTKSGRYGAVCHIPVGTTSVEDLEEGDEDEHGGGEEPHWEEGMLTTFKVTKA
jgi:hypothetical protein